MKNKKIEKIKKIFSLLKLKLEILKNYKFIDFYDVKMLNNNTLIRLELYKKPIEPKVIFDDGKIINNEKLYSAVIFDALPNIENLELFVISKIKIGIDTLYNFCIK